MQEQITQTESVKFVFHPKDDEKTDAFTNEYVEKMPRDENLRYEIIGGELIVSTAPRFIHQLLEFRLTLEIGIYLKENPIGQLLTTPGLIFSEFDGVIPDLIYISHEQIDEILDEESGKFHGSPEIVIEILSPGKANARRDLQVKRELFEIYDVPEYWVVNPFEKEIVVFQLEKGKLRQTKICKEDEYLETSFLPDFKLEIKNLFAN